MSGDLNKVFDAILGNDLATLRQLLTANPALATSRSEDDQPTTALHLAAEINKRAMLFALLFEGADPNARNSRNDTPLHSLIRYNYNCAPALRILLNAGADPSITNNEGQTPLDILMRDYRRDQEELSALLKRTEKTFLERGDEFDPEIPQRKPDESEHDYVRRWWHALKSSDALSAFYNRVFENDDSLHHRDKLLEYLGPPADMDDSWINYEAEDKFYIVSFLMNKDGDIEGWKES